jgi:DNA modification methylase
VTPVGYLETGVLYCDDNLQRLAQFPAECIDLIYLDPPFFSNRNYEVIWGDEAEVRSFEDRWEGGVHHYIDWMRERMIEMHRVLKPTGVIFLHCDWHASHYLKQMMDDVFGASRFQNEIVWCYRGGGVPKTAWARKHDTIFFYSKGSSWYYKPQYVPYSASTQAVTGKTGRRVNQTEIDLERGAHMPDWWPDINSLQTWDQERLGYPTQKPEALIERILTGASEPNAIVLDPFCGCGTTVVVAERMKRQWIGIDISPTAVGLMKRRLDKVGATNVKLVGMPVSEQQLRALKPFEFQNWVIQRFNGTHSTRKSGDMGIDGYSFLEHLPIQVKQSESVGRNVVDNFQTAVRRDGKHKGYIVAFSFTRGAIEEAARAKLQEGIEIQLVRVADLLADVVDLVTPTDGQLIPDVPLPPSRPKEARPSADELVESDRNGDGGEEDEDEANDGE